MPSRIVVKCVIIIIVRLLLTIKNKKYNVNFPWPIFRRYYFGNVGQIETLGGIFGRPNGLYK